MSVVQFVSSKFEGSSQFYAYLNVIGAVPF